MSTVTSLPSAGGRAPSGQLCLFDGLAPFFLYHREGTINWSKIPFAHLDRDGLLDSPRMSAIIDEFDRHVAAMAALGYNAVALDDLAHMVSFPFYPDRLRHRLELYRRMYARLFASAQAHGLRVFAVTDYLFLNESIERHVHANGIGAAEFFRTSVCAALDAWPELDGVVVRIGESDGIDVHGDFKSQLVVTAPREARALLRTLLPAMEARGKTLVFRTWTLGAYPVGDLMWNRQTYDAVFGEISSPCLVVSLKYGDADFFRYLDLNPLFFHGSQRKIVELQCRRGYEGMGEYPSFVGDLYDDHLRRLRAGRSNLIGIYALQGGGWAPFRRTAFTAHGSLWNELNTETTIRLFNNDGTLDEIIARFCSRHGIGDPRAFRRLLTLANLAIEEGLYIREYAQQAVYFRRVRLPPLAWVFWNNVTTGGIVAMVTRYLVRDREAAVRQGHRAVAMVEEMLALARGLGLPEEGIRFQLDSFRVLALAREVLLGMDSDETRQQLRALLADYERAHPDGYRVFLPTDGEARGAGWLRLLVPLLLRRQSRYRRRDRLMLSSGVTRLMRSLAGSQHAALPRFVDSQGMASDVLLR